MQPGVCTLNSPSSNPKTLLLLPRHDIFFKEDQIVKEISEGHGILEEQNMKRRPWGKIEAQLSAQTVLLLGS